MNGQRIFGDQNRRLGVYMCNLAITYKAQGRFEKALELEESTLELHRCVLAGVEERSRNSLFSASTFSDLGLE